MKKDVKTWCHCCKVDTYHNVLFEIKNKVSDDLGIQEELIAYMTLRCGGCKKVSFLTRKIDPFAGADEFSDKNYFHKLDEDEFNILREKDYDHLPVKVQDLYDEITTAFEKDLKVMAGVGLRTLVEAVCLHQKIPGRNLQDKIKAMHNSGLISAAEQTTLDKLRLIGNQSTHGIRSFSIEKLSYALDIINHILISVYVLPRINRRLKV